MAWRLAHVLCINTLRAVERHKGPRAYALFDQLRRAAISVEANIVEGYGLGTPNLFRRHLRIAIGSAAETECLLRISQELEYLPNEVVTELLAQSERTLGLLKGLIRSQRLR